MPDLKEITILFKDERMIKIKTRRFMKNENKFECFDEERKLYFVSNFNEIEPVIKKYFDNRSKFKGEER